MGDGDKDLAYNESLKTCDTGIQNRRQNLVIRIRHDEDLAKSSSVTPWTLETKDDTGAGKVWGHQELDFSDPTITAKDLVVVVGELLPVDFDYTKKQKVQRKRQIVVRGLADKITVLYMLFAKRRGLCRIAPLPKSCEYRIVYYKEWVHGTDDVGMAKERTLVWKKNTVGFSRQWIEDHADIFGWDKKPKPKKTINVHHDILREMMAGKDDFSENDAKKAAAACQTLWPQRPGAKSPPKLDAKFLSFLARCLRLHAAGGEARVEIKEGLYGPFISRFWRWYQFTRRRDDPHAAIRDIYGMVLAEWDTVRPEDCNCIKSKKRKFEG